MGQQKIAVELNWGRIQTQKTVKNLSVNYLSFENSSNLYEFGSLPLYTFSLPLAGEFLEYELSIQNILADTLFEKEALLLTDIDFASRQIEYRVVPQSDHVDVFILPFQLLETENTYLQFQEFTVFVDIVPSEGQKTISPVEPEYTNESVLNTGDWYKLGVEKSGVHKIGYTDLEALGIDPRQVNPKKLGIFGNYSGMLSEDNNVARADDLQENSIFMQGAEDGSFDPDDYLLFYAKAANQWRYNIFTSRFDFQNNLYADTTFYFLTTNKGNNKRVLSEESSTQPSSESIDSFYDFMAHESELESLIYSGKQWYGERLTLDSNERVISFNFPGLKTNRPVYMSFEMAVRAIEHTYYRIYVNDEIVLDSTRVLQVSTNGSYARETTRKFTFFADSEHLDVKVKFYTTLGTSIAWINFIELNVERELSFEGGQMGFRNPHIAAAGNVVRYNFDQCKDNAVIWDLSENQNPIQIEYVSDNNGSIHFTLPNDTIRDFIIFEKDQAYQPILLEKIVNQDLHGISQINLVVISPEIFLEQANRYAQIHREQDNLTVEVFTPQQIYNEFSSGSQDITAIRDFMRMLYLKDAFGNKPGYLLLFGDGSYDYKHRVHQNTNFIPTYQSKESLRHTLSYATDDYFGLLDYNEGFNCNGVLDVGIGRFPVSTKEQATTAVNKIEYYLAKNSSVMRNWRNDICFIADDQDGNLHLKQASQLVNIVDTIPASFVTNKIFIDAYTKVSTPDGKRYPDVNPKIDNQVTDGALIVNYTGHGGLTGWSSERILDVPTIRAWENLDNMPLFITATCEFSRFDDPEFVSAGEHTFLNENGGAIALMTTTRLAFAAANITINRRIYYHLMDNDIDGHPRLGDLMRMSKDPSSISYLNFTLLGDPALRLVYPKHEVSTTNISNKTTGHIADTVFAMSLITIQGEIVDNLGNKLPNFKGYIYPKVYDKPTKYTTLGNDAGSYPADFYLTDKILYAGKVSVVDGKFEFEVQIPKDISYSFGFGEISYYAIDTVNFEDAWGKHEELFIGGIDEQAEVDDVGPQIGLFLDDRSFESGNTTSSSPLLLADLFDEQGIHNTGQSLGRDLSMVLDNDYSNTQSINQYFSPDVDSYQRGEVKYQFSELSNGWHTLSLKAWDLQNNSSEETVDFYVNDEAEIMLREVINYPNPFTEQTNFGFIHNKSGAQLDVEIKIYDMNGQFVVILTETVSGSGYKIDPIVWNGRNQNGDPVNPGLYTYHISVTDTYGNLSVQRQKMIKLSE